MDFAVLTCFALTMFAIYVIQSEWATKQLQGPFGWLTVFGTIAGVALLVYMSWSSLPYFVRSLDVIVADSATMPIGIAMFVSAIAYRIAMTRVAYLKNLPTTTHAYVMGVGLLLSLASCTVISAFRPR